MAATAGPDWVLKDTPRTYVHLGPDAELDFERWKHGLIQGRSFITRGPMLFLSVDGQRPGSRLHYPDRPALVEVEASALMPYSSLPVEIVVNGIVVATGPELKTRIRLEDSAWIAARTGDAHSSPVYVTLQGRPRGFAEEARQFLSVSRRLREWVETKALFDSPEQKATVLAVIRQGERIYETIIERATRLGRTSPLSSR